MNSIERIDPKAVLAFKTGLYRLVLCFQKEGALFHPLELATAAEEFAAEIRQDSADEFRRSHSEPSS